jgi:ATP-dependent DNA ligase
VQQHDAPGKCRHRDDVYRGREPVGHYPPAPVREPPVPMLAHLERSLPRGETWRYEPKLDGFRGLLWHGEGAAAQLLSRNVKDLSAWFPALIEAGKALPANTLVDGEIVIADNLGSSDFGALQARLG